MESLKRISGLDPRDIPLMERVFGKCLDASLNALANRLATRANLAKMEPAARRFVGRPFVWESES